MSWFTEDSTPVLVLGVVTVAILLLAFVKTSRLGLLYAIAGVALVVAAIVFIEKHTDTDTKQIRRQLDAACVAVEKNDVPGVLNLIAPSAKEMQQQVRNLLPQFDIHEAYIRELVVTINRFNNPPTATAEFMGHVNGKERRGIMAEGHYPQRVKVTLHLEGDRWLFDSYEMKGFGIGGKD